jgi:hypothetical protein
MSVVVIMPMVVSYGGSGLSKYTASASITSTEARLTLGNISEGDQRTYLIVTIADLLSMLILLLFWLHWRSFQKAILEEMEKDHSLVNPVRYVVAVDHFCDETTNPKTLEMELRAYVDALYKGAYEVEVVYNYHGNFSRFLEYDEKIEEVEKEHQVIKQTGKSTTRLLALEQELEVMEEELLHVSQIFEPMYAYLHFRTLKAKITFLNHCRHFRLQSTTGQALLRALCCTPQPPENRLFLGKHPLMVHNSRLSRPEEVNWQNIDMTRLSRFVRGLLSLVVVALAILVCSALIGVCTLYVASSSNCQNYSAPSGSTIALQISEVKGRNSNSDTFCYCSANLASLYTNAEINAFCSSVSNTVLVTNALQIGASAVSAATNVVLSIIIMLVAKHLLRPQSIPGEYLFVFWGVLISNVINTGVIPLLLNASIFGVEFYTYLQFIQFIDFHQLSIFSDFTPDWYALIAPYYINFVFIGCLISPLLSLAYYAIKHAFKMWRLQRAC